MKITGEAVEVAVAAAVHTNSSTAISYQSMKAALTAALPHMGGVSGLGSMNPFKIGDRVTKIKGSSWTGRVVGYYSTELTPVGCAVESENEPGSVQIYPASALVGLLAEGELIDGLSAPEQDDEKCRNKWGDLVTTAEAASDLYSAFRASPTSHESIGYRSDLWTVLGECLEAERKAPAPEPAKDGPEVVAWRVCWPGTGSISSETGVTRQKHVADEWAAQGATVTPLVRLSDYEELRDVAQTWERNWTMERDLKLEAIARNAELVKALEPFAEIADSYSDQEDDDFQVWTDFDVLGATLPLRIFRRARAALGGQSNG